MLKSHGVGWVGWCGVVWCGPCDFSSSPSPFGLDLVSLDFGLGLDNNYSMFSLERIDSLPHPLAVTRPRP